MTDAYVVIAGVYVAGHSNIVGESVRGVYSSEALAREAATHVPADSLKSKWKEVATNHWQCAEEYVYIEKHEIDAIVVYPEDPETENTADRQLRLFSDDYTEEDKHLVYQDIDKLTDEDLYAIYQGQEIALSKI
jgi:hypothetical protein